MAAIQAQRLHREMYVALDRELCNGTPEYNHFAVMTGSYLQQGEISRCTSMADLLGVLEARGYIAVGEYGVLKRILSEAYLLASLQMVQKREAEILPILRTDEAEESNAEAQSGKSPITYDSIDSAQRPLEQHNREEEFLGKGSYGTVRRAHRNGRMVAVKTIRVVEGLERTARREWEILANLDHIRIVQCIEVSERPGEIEIILEYMCGNSVADALKKTGTFSNQVTSRYTKQILEGLEYLRSQNILHRDIKGDNILRDREIETQVPSEIEKCHMETNIKLCDFGLSRVLRSWSVATTECGTPGFMAPEVLFGGEYGYPADIWSLGCTVHQMLTARRLALEGPVFRWRAKIPETLGESAKSFMKATLVIDPSGRLNIDQLIKHEFIATTRN